MINALSRAAVAQSCNTYHHALLELPHALVEGAQLGEEVVDLAR
jgi:hypothetical protein